MSALRCVVHGYCVSDHCVCVWGGGWEWGVGGVGVVFWENKNNKHGGRKKNQRVCVQLLLLLDVKMHLFRCRSSVFCSSIQLVCQQEREQHVAGLRLPVVCRPRPAFAFLVRFPPHGCVSLSRFPPHQPFDLSALFNLSPHFSPISHQHSPPRPHPPPLFSLPSPSTSSLHHFHFPLSSLSTSLPPRLASPRLPPRPQ